MAAPKLKVGIIGVIAMGIIIILFSQATIGNLDNATKEKNSNADTGGKQAPVKTNPPTEETIDTIVLRINGKKFIAFIENNDAAQEFAKAIPFQLDMVELSGNEKYYKGKDKLSTADEYEPVRIKAGDLMLYGDDTIVLFYEDFDTEEKYTRLGWVQNAYELKDALGSGDVSIDFTKQ